MLIVNSSPRRNSVSRRLTRHYAGEWKVRNPGGHVIERDLNAEPLPFVSDAWIEAAYTPAEVRTPEQAKILALSDRLIEELLSADQILLGVPMHNFSVPAPLKAWIDLITRAGKTFRYGSNGPEGLIASEKSVIAVISQGGTYGAGSSADFQVPYLRHMLRFLGLTDVTVVHADRQAFGEEVARQSVASAVERLSAVTATSAVA